MLRYSQKILFMLVVLLFSASSCWAVMTALPSQSVVDGETYTITSAGAFVFTGSVGSGNAAPNAYVAPNENDSFNLQLGTNQELTSATLTFGTNLWKPPAEVQVGGVSPSWTVTKQGAPTPVFTEKINFPTSTPNGVLRLFAPTVVSPSVALALGAGSYSIFLGGQDFGVTEFGNIGYTMTFTTTATPLPPVVLLLGTGLLGLVGIRRKKDVFGF